MGEFKFDINEIEHAQYICALEQKFDYHVIFKLLRHGFTYDDRLGVLKCEILDFEKPINVFYYNSINNSKKIVLRFFEEGEYTDDFKSFSDSQHVRYDVKEHNAIDVLCYIHKYIKHKKEDIENTKALDDKALTFKEFTEIEKEKENIDENIDDEKTYIKKRKSILRLGLF